MKNLQKNNISRGLVRISCGTDESLPQKIGKVLLDIDHDLYIEK